MQKAYFFITAAIFIISISMPIMCMEPSSTTTEIPKLCVELVLSEITQQNIEEPLNPSRDHNNKHAYNVLNIPWDKNEKQYKVHFAFLFKNKKPNKTWEWTMFHPTFLPLSTIPSNNLRTDTVYFPTIVSTSFVKELKEKGSITLTDKNLSSPVEIIVRLKLIQHDSNNINTSKTSRDLLKKFPPTPTEAITTTKKTNTVEESDADIVPTKPTSYKTTTYIFTGIAAVGIIAYIIYLYKNNQLNTQFFSYH